MKSLLLLVLISVACLPTLEAQSFGRNKPRYRSFDFKVQETPHFDIHHYLKNRDVLDQVSGMTEQWYDYHQSVLRDTFYDRNPVIFYNNHADFQQTNSISGNISVGTGGVTEAFKNRVVMPLTFTNQQTWQVLGHELVHAFQFDIVLNGDSTSIRNLANLPLWVVEGMAEYMTMGRVDPFTAMWMKDAIIQDKVPTIDQMASPRYFPYRYGQAMWSFLTSKYGDGVIEPFFRNTAQYGLSTSIPYILLADKDELSKEWENTMRSFYAPFLNGRKKNTVGKKLLSEENSGRINVSPSLSPDGRYVIYLSEKDLFSTDLFMADARTGKVIRKITSLVKDSDLDNLNYLESAGTWSPDSKRFAFVAFKKGKNVLIIKETETGKTLDEIFIKNVPAFASPTWSPDGQTIVVTGLVEGQADLYAINLRNGRATQLTNDVYSEIQPSFHRDGGKITFAYDKRSVVEGRAYGRYTFDIAEMDLVYNRITTLPVFPAANNLNPNYDMDGNILFVSDRDGTRNLYKYVNGKVLQMTRLSTGISGISRFSPMIGVSQSRDRIIYTHYFNSGYSIYQSKADRFLNEEVDPMEVDIRPGTLPGTQTPGEDIVHQQLYNADDYSFAGLPTRSKRYKPQFKLDYVGGGAGVGVSNNTFGNYTGLQGGVDLIFSDMLGNNQLYTQLALNGEIFDAGGQITYINRKNRLAYGAGISHIPLRTGYQSFANDILLDQNGNPVNVLRRSTDIIRIFDETLSGFVQFPFSTTLRLEGGISGSFRFFRQDRYDDYFDQFGRLVFNERTRIETGDVINLNQFYRLERGFGGNANIALVGDNSYFGLTSPLAGQRYRLSLERSVGNNDFTGVLIDYRKYYWMRPFSFAFRGTGYARFENEANTLFPIYVGQMGFVRGFGTIFGDNVEEMGLSFGQLIGSKVGVLSFEIRIPFTGPKQLALIGSSYFFSDLAFFIDSGVAFEEFNQLSEGIDQLGGAKPVIATSAGISLRVNLLGALILEPHIAWPLREGGIRTFGLNFIPGW